MIFVQIERKIKDIFFVLLVIVVRQKKFIFVLQNNLTKKKIRRKYWISRNIFWYMIRRDIQICICMNIVYIFMNFRNTSSCCDGANNIQKIIIVSCLISIFPTNKKKKIFTLFSLFTWCAMYRGAFAFYIWYDSKWMS